MRVVMLLVMGAIAAVIAIGLVSSGISGAEGFTNKTGGSLL